MKKLILIMYSIFLINVIYAKDDINSDWEPTDSVYGDWINIGPVYGCLDWKPYKSIMLKDEMFKQTSEKCKQDITRTVQDRFKNKKTNESKNSEKLKYQNAVKITASSRDIRGVAECVYTPENSGLPMTYWFVSKVDSTHLYMIMINGMEIKSGTAYNMNSTIYNGVKYNKGKEMKKSISGYRYSYYEVCK